MWISTDPALGDYIPVAPTNDEAKQHNSKLPGMGGVFNHINLNCYHYAGNNPVRYVDPDGRYAYSVEIEKGKFALATSSLKGKLVDDVIGFVPFGGSMLSLINIATNRKNLNSSEFESIVNDSKSYIFDFLSGVTEVFEGFEDISKKNSNFSNLLGGISVVNDILSSYLDGSDTDIDTLTSKAFSRLCNYSITGKSHEAVAKKYFMARGLIETLLKNGKLTYSKDWKNDITSIQGTGIANIDKNTLALLRCFTKKLDALEE